MPTNPFLDGGLPRFLALKDEPDLHGQTTAAYEKHNRWDFTKVNDSLKAVRLDETGHGVEKIAMEYHATRRSRHVLPRRHSRRRPRRRSC